MSRGASADERVYRALLRAYPRRFREEYGHALLGAFRDRRRDAHEGRARLWPDILLDLARSAPALRVDALRARGQRHTRLEEVSMRTMGALATLIGVIEVMNAAIELSAAASIASGAWLVSVVLGLLLGILLVVAGVALLRRAPSATMLARHAAVACLALMLLMRFMGPWMSIFGLILGIIFPIALLIFSMTGHDRGSAAPRAV
jgi:hypothetical protein